MRAPTSLVASLLLLLVSALDAQSAAIPSGNGILGSSLLARSPLQARAPPSLASPNANANIKVRSPRSFNAPRAVPMPLLNPRSGDADLGERDNILEDRHHCAEGSLHDCNVGREAERLREKRLVRAIKRSPLAKPKASTKDADDKVMR